MGIYRAVGYMADCDCCRRNATDGKLIDYTISGIIKELMTSGWEIDKDGDLLCPECVKANPRKEDDSNAEQCG